MSDQDEGEQLSLTIKNGALAGPQEVIGMQLSVDLEGKTRKQTFAEVEHNGRSILISLTQFRKTKTMGSVHIYKKVGETAIPTREYVRAGLLRENGIY